VKECDVKSGSNRGSSVRIVINLPTGKCTYLISIRSGAKRCFSPSQCPMTILDFTHPPSQSLSDVLSSAAKWVACETDYLLESRLLKL